METSDTIEITTPSGKRVVIRTYTTYGDDSQVEPLLYEGSTIVTDEQGDEVFLFTPLGLKKASDKYVELLVQSIDGDQTNILQQLERLTSADYDAVKAE